MSQENCTLVREGFAAWNAGDMEALRETYDDAIVMRPPEGWPEPGPFVGRDAVMHQWEQMRETWDADALETLSDFVGVGDYVVVRYVWRGVGHGPESNMEITGVFAVRDHKIVSIEFFWDHGEALKATGLPP